MLDDTLGELDNSEEIEDAAEEEVDKVLFELTAGKYTDRSHHANSKCLPVYQCALKLVMFASGQLGKAPAAVRDSLPVANPRAASKQPVAAAALAAEGADDDDDDVADMQARLAALRS